MENQPISLEPKSVFGLTWASRKKPTDAEELLARMRAAGLPLASDETEDSDESSKSCITACISILNGKVHALVASPSGIIYEFAPEQFEALWWSFALRHYYIVTGNMSDRQALAEMAVVELAVVKGKVLSRLKSNSPSGMTLPQLLENACPQQTALF